MKYFMRYLLKVFCGLLLCYISGNFLCCIYKGYFHISRISHICHGFNNSTYFTILFYCTSLPM